MSDLITVMEKAIQLEFSGMAYNEQPNKDKYLRRPASQGKNSSRTYSC
jgi:hypothetical protein